MAEQQKTPCGECHLKPCEICDICGAVEPPPKPVAWMWKEWGWCVTAHGKNRQIITRVDQVKPPQCTIDAVTFVSLHPLYLQPDNEDVINERERGEAFRMAWNQVRAELKDARETIEDLRLINREMEDRMIQEKLSGAKPQ